MNNVSSSRGFVDGSGWEGVYKTLTRTIQCHRRTKSYDVPRAT